MLRGADNIAAVCTRGQAGEREPLLSPVLSRSAWSSPCPCFYFWWAQRDPAAVSAPLANCGVSLPGAGWLGKALREGAAGRSEWAAVAGCCPAGSCKAQWGCGSLGGVGGFGLQCKSWWGSQATHKKAVYGLARELGRNFIPP